MLGLVLSYPVVGQNYETIYDRSTTFKPIASEIDSAGFLWIVGGNPLPFVLKLDSNGNELLYKGYSEFPVTEQHDGFLDDIAISDNGRIFVTGYHSKFNTFVMEIDPSGNKLAYVDFDLGNDFSEKARTLFTHNNQFYINYLNIRNGGILETCYFYELNTSGQTIDTNRLGIYEGYWLNNIIHPSLFNTSGEPVLVIRKSVPLNGDRMPDSTISLTITSHGVVEESNRIKGFPIYGSVEGYHAIHLDKPNFLRYFLVHQDNDFNIVDSLEINRYQKLQVGLKYSNLTDVAANTDYGLILGIDTRLDSVFKSEILQVHPTTFEILDSVIFDKTPSGSQAYLGDFVSRDNWMYNIHAHYGGYSGIRVQRIYLDEFDKIENGVDFYLSNAPRNESGFLASDNEFTFYPNPTSSTININFEQVQEATIGIYSLTGALVLQKQVNTQNAQLDVSGLPEGMYVVHVKTAQGIESQKVVISK
jgi:hypothetical protein